MPGLRHGGNDAGGSRLPRLYAWGEAMSKARWQVSAILGASCDLYAPRPQRPQRYLFSSRSSRRPLSHSSPRTRRTPRTSSKATGSRAATPTARSERSTITSSSVPKFEVHMGPRVRDLPGRRKHRDHNSPANLLKPYRWMSRATSATNGRSRRSTWCSRSRRRRLAHGAAVHPARAAQKSLT